MSIATISAQAWSWAWWPFMAEDGNGTDASRIKFPIDWAWRIGLGAFALGATMYFANAPIREALTESEKTQALIQADIRVIMARMEGRVEVDSVNAKLNEERLATIRAEIASLRNRVELLQFEVQSQQKEMNSRRSQ